MKRSNESAITAASSNSSSCEGQPNKVGRFNPAPTFIDQHPATKGVSVTGCYWPDGSPADGGARGAEESLNPFDALYPCLDPDKTYSPDEAVVCCWSGDVCFGEAKLCGIPIHQDGDKTKGAFSTMYRGGCTAQPDTWADAAGCPQKCLDPSRPFENILGAEVVVMACDDPGRADNLTLYCSNDGIDPTKCDHDGAALDGYGKDEAWGMMASETLQIHGVAFSTVTSIPTATSSGTSSTSSTSSATSTTAVMGTYPPNVIAPNSPNTTTIILAVGIPLGLLFFFGMLAVAFVCYRRRNGPQPEGKRRSFTVLNVNHATARPDDTNSLGTPYSERNVLPGPLSSNPILPLCPSDTDLTAIAGTSEIPQQSIRTLTPHPEHDSHPTPDHPRRSSTPTPWPVPSSFTHAHPNQNSNRNSHAGSLRRFHTEGDFLSSPITHHRQSHHSTSSTVPFPSYSEPNIGSPPDSGPQFPFYSREVHDRLQQMEYERGLQKYYAAAAADLYHGGLDNTTEKNPPRESYYVELAADDGGGGGGGDELEEEKGDTSSKRSFAERMSHQISSHQSLPSQQQQQQRSYRPPSQQFDFDFPVPAGARASSPARAESARATSLPAPVGGGPTGVSTRMYTYGYGRPAVGVGRPQIVQIGPRGGSAGSGESRVGTGGDGEERSREQRRHERGESTGTVRNVGFGGGGGGADEEVGRARQQSVGAGVYELDVGNETAPTRYQSATAAAYGPVVDNETAHSRHQSAGAGSYGSAGRGGGGSGSGGGYLSYRSSA